MWSIPLLDILLCGDKMLASHKKDTIWNDPLWQLFHCNLLSPTFSPVLYFTHWCSTLCRPAAVVSILIVLSTLLTHRGLSPVSSPAAIKACKIKYMKYFTEYYWVCLCWSVLQYSGREEKHRLFFHTYTLLYNRFRLTATAVRWFSSKFVDWKFRNISQFSSNFCFAMLVNVVTCIYENNLETVVVLKIVYWQV